MFTEFVKSSRHPFEMMKSGLFGFLSSPPPFLSIGEVFRTTSMCWISCLGDFGWAHIHFRKIIFRCLEFIKAWIFFITKMCFYPSRVRMVARRKTFAVVSVWIWVVAEFLVVSFFYDCFFDKRRSIIAKGFEKIPFVTDGISWQLSWSAAKDLWSNLRIKNCWPPYFVLSLDGVEGPRLPLIMAPQDQNAKWLKNEDSSKLNIMLPNCKIANSSTNDFSILI